MSSTGVELIAAERKRQIEVEGWDAAHDAGHADELAQAAACYAVPAADAVDGAERMDGWTTVPASWPWDGKWWKPTPGDRVRELVKAGALIAAAIDAELNVR